MSQPFFPTNGEGTFANCDNLIPFHRETRSWRSKSPRRKTIDAGVGVMRKKKTIQGRLLKRPQDWSCMMNMQSRVIEMIFSRYFARLLVVPTKCKSMELGKPSTIIINKNWLIGHPYVGGGWRKHRCGGSGCGGEYVTNMWRWWGKGGDWADQDFLWHKQTVGMPDATSLLFVWSLLVALT